MKKTRTLVALLIAFMMIFTFALTACNPTHECAHKCATCGKCTSDCTDPACESKCESNGNHGSSSTHTCTHKCPTCGKCTSDCTDPACADKCQYDGTHPTEPTDPLAFDKGTVLRMATGYNSAETGITFSAKIAGSGIKLADGKTYNTGDLKPTWVEVQNRFGMVFEDKYQGKNATNEWDYWKEQLDKVDMVSGTASKLNEAGAAGQVINIAQYLDKMPNFKAYLDANPIVRLSITGATEGKNKGAIYFSPYFDGVNDIERMPLMRADMVMALLDGTETYTGANRAVQNNYTPYMPTTGTVAVTSLTVDGTATQTITKDYTKYGNIIEKMNAETDLTGDKAVAMFREYIDQTYGDTYAKRSDLFLGYDAAWDADELVALMRCAVASLNDSDGNPITGMFPREGNNQRQVDLFRFAGTLFGVRGLESRQDYLYINGKGELVDARQQADTYQAIEKMNQMFKDGLITIDSGAATSGTYLEKDAGLVSYDYSQTQTIYNETKLQEGEKYMAVMVPVAKWFDGTNVVSEVDQGTYMRFTESWRSVKTDGWALSKAGIGNDTNKLNAALKLIDYAYSKEGQILMSYGPDSFIKMDGDKYVTFDFNGEQWPEISDATYAELWEKASGNYTNYARQYLGSTLSFLKSQSFEYQCTHEVGREGAAKLSAAIGKGTIKHPELAVAANKWYMSVPTVLPTTDEDNTMLNSYTELTSSGQFNQSKTGNANVLVTSIKDGLDATFGVTSIDAIVEKVSGKGEGQWKGSLYLQIKQDAFDRLLMYYNEINK
ncbi:MAG: hypothetical protein NC350_00410 [Corallococcus sp.]|nr:hypothetical protein [Corallococcus sp.]